VNNIEVGHINIIQYGLFACKNDNRVIKPFKCAMMILNDFLGNSDRIAILESFLDNECYELTLEDIQRISEVPNPSSHLKKLMDIGIISENDGKYLLNNEDKRILCLSLINNEEYLRQLDKMEEEGIFEDVKLFTQDNQHIERCK